MYYLDIDYDDLNDAKDIIAAHTSTVPYASYRHPSDSDFHRMEFRDEGNRNQVQNALGRFDVESFPLDAR